MSLSSIAAAHGAVALTDVAVLHFRIGEVPADSGGQRLLRFNGCSRKLPWHARQRTVDSATVQKHRPMDFNIYHHEVRRVSLRFAQSAAPSRNRPSSKAWREECMACRQPSGVDPPTVGGDRCSASPRGRVRDCGTCQLRVGNRPIASVLSAQSAERHVVALLRGEPGRWRHRRANLWGLRDPISRTRPDVRMSASRLLSC